MFPLFGFGFLLGPQHALEAIQKARHSPVYRNHFYVPFWDALHHRFNQLLAKDLTA